MKNKIIPRNLKPLLYLLLICGAPKPAFSQMVTLDSAKKALLLKQVAENSEVLMTQDPKLTADWISRQMTKDIEHPDDDLWPTVKFINELKAKGFEITIEKITTGQPELALYKFKALYVAVPESITFSLGGHRFMESSFELAILVHTGHRWNITSAADYQRMFSAMRLINRLPHPEQTQIELH